jgi:hypothetical protein
MFVRVNKNSRGSAYVQIVRSYRENGKVRQEVLFTFGRLDTLQATGQLDGIVKALSKFALKQQVIDLSQDLSIEKVYYLGAAHVIKRMMERLGLVKFFENLALQHPKMKIPLVNILMGMILNRFIEPSSKRRLHHEQWKQIYPEILGNQEPPLKEFYRSMDLLWKHKDSIEGAMFDQFGQRDLFHQELDVVFYDTTTLRFESTDAERGELRRFGYSKEHRSDCTQVVLGLLIDKDGVPVGYELFSGSTYDSKSLPKIVEKLKKKYRIGQIIFVADRGMISKKNLEELREAKLEFILGMRLWSLTQKEQDEIVKGKERQALNKEKSVLVREMDYHGERLILSWTEERAKRDSQVRNDLLDKIRKQLEVKPNTKQFVTHKGYRQYLKGLESGHPQLDEQSIEASRKRDGFFGVLTNVSKDKLSQTEAYDRYRELWRIEDAFGEIKGPLETRPMFHWTDRRIQSHVLICLLAYYVESVITRDLRQEKAEFTAGEWFRALNKIYAVPVVARGVRAWVRNEIEGVAKRGYEFLHLKIPDRVLKLEQIELKKVS